MYARLVMCLSVLIVLLLKAQFHGDNIEGNKACVYVIENAEQDVYYEVFLYVETIFVFFLA